MRVGLNLLFMIPGEVGGTQTYSVGLIDALSRLDSQNEYYLFVNQEARGFPWPERENFQIVPCPIRASSRPARLIWEQTMLPRFAARCHIDLLHSLGYVSPLRTPYPSVVTVHDLNYRFIPQAFSLPARLTQKFLVESSIRRADHVLAVSQFTKSQIVQCLPVSPAKITVTPEAPKQVETSPHARIARWEAVTARFRIRQPYLVAFSSKSPHKNMHGLLKAYRLARDAYQLESQLVLIGHLPPQMKRCIQDPIEASHPGVVFTGYLDDTDLAGLLEKASLFVFPSFYEGFGLPVLEAMQLGVPAACSNRGSIPEVAGEAVVYFDPGDPDQMAATIACLMQDEARRDQLRRLGREQVSRFSWEHTARETLRVYRSQLK